MSEKEFDQKDNEVFQMVNGKRPDSQIDKLAIKKQTNAESCREVLWMVLKVFICSLIATMFLMAMLEPTWVPVLSYLGMAVCLIVATVTVDRYVRKQCRG